MYGLFRLSSRLGLLLFAIIMYEGGRNKVKNKTKRALTGSVISVLVCTAMLVGTTFAWFTDSVSTGKNTITAGSLTVDLIDEEGNSLEGKTLNWSVADGRAQEEILWEPGAVYVTEGFRVKNTGNLALKYKLTVDGAAGDDKLLEAIELSVVKEAGKEGEAVDIDSYEGHLEGGETESDMLYIRAHMKEDAGNDYMGLKLEGIGITVAAAQDTVETDSFDSQYDAAATYLAKVDSLDSFKEALKDGNSIVLEAGLNIPGMSDGDFVSDKVVVVDFNGQTITSSNGNAATRVKAGEVTFKDGTITAGANDYCTVIVADATSNIENMVLNNSKQYGMSLKVFDGGVMNINNSTVNSTNGGGGAVADGGVVNISNSRFDQKGVYDHNSSLVAASNGGTSNVYSGVFSGESYGLYVFNSGGTINVYDGEFSAATVLKADNSTTAVPSVINIYGGSFSGGITIGNASELNITGGTFENTGLSIEEFEAFVPDGYSASEADGVFTVLQD